MSLTEACITTFDLSFDFELLMHQSNSGYQVFRIAAEGLFSVEIRSAGDPCDVGLRDASHFFFSEPIQTLAPLASTGSNQARYRTHAYTIGEFTIGQAEQRLSALVLTSG